MKLKVTIPEAASRYRSLQTEISFQLKALKEKLKAHRPKTEPINWGHVSELADAKLELGSLIHSFSNGEEDPLDEDKVVNELISEANAGNQEAIQKLYPGHR